MRSLLASGLLILILLPVRGDAADTAAVAAALPDEASECRYILRLCEARRPQIQRVKENSEKVNRKLAADKQNPPGSMTEHRQRLVENQLLLEETDQELQASMKKGGELYEAMTVIRAKHEQMPACFEQCQDVIKIEKFR